MKRQQLEHIIRAAAGTAQRSRDYRVIRSQSILGAFPNAPAELLASEEADVFPKDDPARSIVIDGAIGELSLFHQTYAHGVDENTAILPDDWRDRLVKVETSGTAGAIGWCLEPHDLAVSKLAAGREHDLSFVESMVKSKLAASDIIRERIAKTSRLSPELKKLATDRLARFSSG